MFTMFKLVDAYLGLRLGADLSTAPQGHVIAVVSDYVRRGGEALYSCAPTNAPSIATARSVGFVAYAQSMVLAAPS
jgi:hypothetical protein